MQHRTWTLLVAIGLLAGCTASTTTLRPIGINAAVSGEVPWISTPGTVPAPSPVPIPPPPPTAARPCHTSDVEATVAHPNGAGGSLFVTVSFRNISHSTCALLGDPGVAALVAGASPMKAILDRSSFGPSGRMAPGGTTYLDVYTETYCNADPSGSDVGAALARRFTVTFPHNGGTLTLTRPAGPFSLRCGLHATPFWVDQEPVQVPPDPLTYLRVTIEPSSATAHAGQWFDYVLDVRNPDFSRISLKPCFTYIEAMNTPATVKDYYALNCAAAPSVPARSTIRFAMRVLIPSGTPAGSYQLNWVGPLITLIGRVTVRVA